MNLDDPATTLALLQLNAVVGVTGFFDADGSLRSMGIQCALCHSTVDDSFAPGMGHRLDGWAKRDLDVGAIVNLAPNLAPVAALLGGPEATLRSVPKCFSTARWNMHTRDEIGIDAAQAARAPDRRYRTWPLAGLWTRTKGGFYHDGRFATLTDVVRHYDATFALGLSATEIADVVEFLRSL